MNRCTARLVQLRCLSHRRFVPSFSSVASDQLLLPSAPAAAAVVPPSLCRSLPLHRSFAFPLLLQTPLCYRTYSTGSSSPNIQIIKTENEFNQSLKKVEDDGSAAIFYFTAVWCGPCKFIAPIIEKLSKKYSHVTTYKVDIDEEGLGNKLSELRIYSVPTLHFFQNGKKVSEVIGADVTRLEETMEKLYSH